MSMHDEQVPHTTLPTAPAATPTSCQAPSAEPWPTELLQANAALRAEIAKRQQAEAALAAEHNLLRTLINSLPDYIYVKDTASRFLLLNEAVKRQLGAASVEEVVGKTDLDFSPPELAEQYYAAEQTLFRSSQALVGHEELIFDHATGAQRWVLTTKVPFRNGHDEVAGLVGMNRDITELRQTQEAYRMLVEHSLQGLAILQDFRIVFANPALAQISGYTIAELMALSPVAIQALVHPEDQTLVFGHLQNCLADRQTPVHFVFRFIRKDGAVRWVEKYASHILFQGRAAVQIAYLDITERKQAEEEKSRLLAAVSQQRTELHALATRLAEVQESERQLLARELHDQVGQNLSALGFNLNFIRMQIPHTSPKAALIWEHINDALALVEQTTERVRDVLAELRPPMLDDYGLVDTLDWYAGRFAARVGLAITVQGQTLTPRLAPPVENALFRIAQEALTNVTKHAQATQAVLSIEADSQRVRLTVADNGIGFTPIELTSGVAKQGWGLRIMHERAAMVGGQCSVTAQPGQGVSIVVEVPR